MRYIADIRAMMWLKEAARAGIRIPALPKATLTALST